MWTAADDEALDAFKAIERESLDIAQRMTAQVLVIVRRFVKNQSATHKPLQEWTTVEIIAASRCPDPLAVNDDLPLALAA